MLNKVYKSYCLEGINSRIRSSLLSVQGGILGDTESCKLGPSLEQPFLSGKTNTKIHNLFILCISVTFSVSNSLIKAYSSLFSAKV